VRLLLDELYPAAIAVALRDRGHDAVTVAELGRHLLGRPDDVILTSAAENRRALVDLLSTRPGDDDASPLLRIP
jgi:hypothetical protein